MTMFKSGFVTMVGRPNVGKSTLTNLLIGEKISIISDKPQTTRNKIQSVLTKEDYQIVFLDTPGIHKPKHKLGEYMVDMATSTLREVDVVIFVVDESKEIGPGDNYIIEQLKEISTPIILVINKIDKLTKDETNQLIGVYAQTGVFKDIVPLSAKTGANSEVLINTVVKYLPEGPKYFPEDMITDQPERLLIAEIVREKVLQNLREEIPHGVAVDIELIKKRPDKDMIDVNAIIYCERENHKAIIIGKNGTTLKTIGAHARGDIENLLGTKVFLQLWVKPKKDWRNDASMLKNLGYK
jgi:GTPase